MFLVDDPARFRLSMSILPHLWKTLSLYLSSVGFMLRQAHGLSWITTECSLCKQYSNIQTFSIQPITWIALVDLSVDRVFSAKGLCVNLSSVWCHASKTWQAENVREWNFFLFSSVLKIAFWRTLFGVSSNKPFSTVVCTCIFIDSTRALILTFPDSSSRTTWSATSNERSVVKDPITSSSSLSNQWHWQEHSQRIQVVTEKIESQKNTTPAQKNVVEDTLHRNRDVAAESCLESWSLNIGRHFQKHTFGAF